MRYREGVRGTQAQMPEDIGMNGMRVYARANIRRIDEEDTEDQPGFHGWEYDEAVLSSEEYDALKSLTPPWSDSEWNAALRTAERRARYERMDPKVMSLRRLIDLGIDIESNKEKLASINAYCQAVTETKHQERYPAEVIYPQEPA
jgi:hypothetical protein